MKKQSGFTLVEVIVAMAIVAVALPALLTVMMTQADNAVSIRERTLAEWVAINLLEEHRLNYQLSGRVLNGRDTGEAELAGTTWYWHAEGKVTAVEAIRNLKISVGTDASTVKDEPITTLSGYLYEDTNTSGNRGSNRN
ncbi:type II secretion system minor pseudopilin GspI [Marinibactrum halimedae]|uniref:Type II secretion system protein I n=1 Tax=Marinibactrum halimedae TaxID=1444977 RepID=A0AA37TBJ8_9GAMM|nr:type II secretion system minor pseudopilin GspI [Marinibactrum halimedae]MCD9458258.1 type II secretion system minor pseudopilin GspI [Marinibactrum halimedae]GLS27115.1 type II secretion system protein GspI [Marinibactrum halimedae]